MAIKHEHKYALEITGVLVSGLGMMLLVAISAWVTVVLILGSRDIADEQLGTIPSLESDSAVTAYLNNLEINNGRVAGVVDDPTVAETSRRNNIASWLSNVRDVQGLPAAYRDGVLDRNAQNQARLLAQQCSESNYSDWEDALGTRLDEGYASSFSESIFRISDAPLIDQLPDKSVDYSRLFTQFSAVGIGLAEIPASAGCGSGAILVFHMAGL